MQKTLIISIIAATAFSAHADIVQVDEFDSLQFEGFNDLKMDTFDRNPVEAFGGMATLLNTKKSFLHTTGGWSYKKATRAYEGSRLLGTSSGGVEYQFDIAQKSFGGFFSTIDNVAGGSIKFFNGDDLVGMDALNASVGGKWEWNGWSSKNQFDRVVVESNSKGKGFLMQDAMRVLTTQVPAPGSLAILAVGGVIAARRRR